MPPPTTARDHGSPPPGSPPGGRQVVSWASLLSRLRRRLRKEDTGPNRGKRSEGGNFIVKGPAPLPRIRGDGGWDTGRVPVLRAAVTTIQSWLRTWTLVSSGAAHSGRVHVWALHCPSPAGSIDPQTPGPACTGRTPHAPLCAKAGTGSSPSGHWAPRPWAPGFLLTALSLGWGRA